MPVSNTLDDSYSEHKGVRFGPIEVSFPRSDDPDKAIWCNHATGVSGIITDFEDGNLYAVR
jgi:hypothetical protein